MSEGHWENLLTRAVDSHERKTTRGLKCTSQLVKIMARIVVEGADPTKP